MKLTTTYRIRSFTCGALIMAVVGSMLTIGLVAAQQSTNPPKDRKDLLIESLERQRNAQSSQVAICESAYNEQVPTLQQKVADLTAEVAALKKAADDKKPADAPKPADK